MSTYKLNQPVTLPREMEQIFVVLDKSGFFIDGLLVGSWAFPFYRELFGIEYHLRTNDVDFALPREILKQKSGTDLETAFLTKGISPVIDNLTGLQKFLSGTFGIEFLIHRKGGREEIVTVNKYNIHAQSLPFLDLMFISPLEIKAFRYTVRIPSPEALFLHKLIIAPRRKKESKQFKDLEQCSVLAPHLDSDVLAGLVQAYPMSKATVQNIKSSCAAIEIHTDFL